MSAATDFINKIGPMIVKEGKKRGYKIFSTVIAQAVVESRYGQSGLAKYNNFFGLKSGSSWVKQGKPSVVMKTKEEYTPGTLTTINDSFRAYPSMEAGVEGYYDFISTKRYQNLKTATTYRMYAEMLKEDKYATSNSYVNTLCKCVEQYNLQTFDKEQIPGQWVIGQTYTTQQDLNVRKEPNGALVPFDALTEDGKEHAFIGPTGTAVLRKGTNVTVKDIKSTGTCTWLKIPSGWICGKNSKTVYVK